MFMLYYVYLGNSKQQLAISKIQLAKYKLASIVMPVIMSTSRCKYIVQTLSDMVQYCYTWAFYTLQFI